MIILRPYKPDDLQELFELFYETVHKVIISDYTEAQLNVWAPKEPPKELYGSLEANFTRLAITESGQIVGFVELVATGKVRALYTRADYLKRGIGRVLMGAAVEEARRLKIKKVYLESSLTARPFYEKLGFTVKGEKIREVQGEHFRLILMELPL